MFQRKKEERARKEKWLKNQERIKTLHDDLKGLGGVPLEGKEVFSYAAKFFDVVSSFQDEGYIVAAPEELEDKVKILNLRICQAGRSPYGYNRTQKGEKVTIDNTYWGGVYGLFTFTGRVWTQEEGCYYGFKSQWLPKDSKYEENPMTQKVIIDFQIIPFVSYHINKMIELTREILTASAA